MNIARERQRLRFNPLCLTGLVGLFLLLGECRPAPQTPLAGTFLQLTFQQGEWETQRWEKLFDSFQQLGLEELVIQWTVYDQTAFFESEEQPSVAKPPLETLLRLADRAGMRVFVGLAHDSSFWQKIKRDPELLEVYLRRVRLESEGTASLLANLVVQHQSFQGWYLTHEIDDQNWLEPARRQLLFDHLRATTQTLERLTPGSSVSLSGFSSGFAEPRILGLFWQELTQQSGIDRLFFQDGIGAGKLELDTLPKYLDSLRTSLAQSDCQLQIVVELFEQISAPDEAFLAKPASLDRIEQQIAISRQFSDLGPLAFSVPDYMSPEAGDVASALFRQYLESQTSSR